MFPKRRALPSFSIVQQMQSRSKIAPRSLFKRAFPPRETGGTGFFISAVEHRLLMSRYRALCGRAESRGGITLSFWLTFRVAVIMRHPLPIIRKTSVHSQSLPLPPLSRSFPRSPVRALRPSSPPRSDALSYLETMLLAQLASKQEMSNFPLLSAMPCISPVLSELDVVVQSGR